MDDNNKVFGEIIDCDNLHFAIVSEDSKDLYKASAPTYLAPMAEITHNLGNATPNKRYYDGVAMFINMIENDSDVPVVVSGVPLSLASQLTGMPYDEATGMFYDIGTVTDSPWIALAGRMARGAGGYRYFQYLKGKMSINQPAAKTKETNITPNTTKLTYTPVKTVHKFQVKENLVDGVRGVMAETTDENFSSEANWFSQVQTPPDVEAVATTNVEPDTNANTNTTEEETEQN